MTEVFNVIFDMFGSVIGWLKQIPITQNVSMFDFSLAILVLTIVAVAFVPLVNVGSTSPAVAESVDNIRFKQQTKRDLNKAIQAQKDLEKERGY